MFKGKVVTNLLRDISTARDILESRDKDKIYKNLFFLGSIPPRVETQLKKYIKDNTHELDFNHEDIKALSDEAFENVKNLQQKFLYDKYYKDITKELPITGEMFNTYSLEVAKLMKIDRQLREFYKKLGYSALTIFLWSRSEERKDFTEQLTELIRSFI